MKLDIGSMQVGLEMAPLQKDVKKAPPSPAPPKPVGAPLPERVDEVVQMAEKMLGMEKGTARRVPMYDGSTAVSGVVMYDRRMTHVMGSGKLW